MNTKADSTKWTKRIPSKPGWYWEWNYGYVRVIEVYKWTYLPQDDDPMYRYGWSDKKLWVTPPSRLDSHPVPVDQFAHDTKWSGPIDEPEGDEE